MLKLLFLASVLPYQHISNFISFILFLLIWFLQWNQRDGKVLMFYYPFSLCCERQAWIKRLMMCYFYEWCAVYDEQCLSSICISISWLKFLAEVGVSQNQVSNSRDVQTEAGKLNLLSSPFSIGVLQEIARRCSSKVKMHSGLTRDTLLYFWSTLFLFGLFTILCPTLQVEFRSVVSTSKDLQFSVEVSVTVFPCWKLSWIFTPVWTSIHYTYHFVLCYQKVCISFCELWTKGSTIIISWLNYRNPLFAMHFLTSCCL